MIFHSFQITRHGSRSPVLTYPNDPYPYHDNRYWPAGNGQLTKYGHQQMYASGINYRRRLNGFLPLQYNPNYTLARTNLFDRDFTSAACFLAGLYPPQGYQLWNSFIPWQPIPIWQEPFDIAEVSPALRNITKMLNSKADGSMKPAERLVYLEAAHDITIQALLAALGVTTKLVIKTSASMAFELHKPPFAEHQIQASTYLCYKDIHR
ncbi:hypothetical protein AAG570_011065 [Ranatra chinensis]|uniref:2-phosphoxylose phosphatase 1 n=1 Tax=Ranatra chinensis TaxID=642074 RepID=A0ABD0YJH8_9HEMI